MASKFDKDFLAFFDEGYNLELEPLLTLVWAIGSPESSAPLLKALGSGWSMVSHFLQWWTWVEVSILICCEVARRTNA